MRKSNIFLFKPTFRHARDCRYRRDSSRWASLAHFPTVFFATSQIENVAVFVRLKKNIWNLIYSKFIMLIFIMLIYWLLLLGQLFSNGISTERFYCSREYGWLEYVLTHYWGYDSKLSCIRTISVCKNPRTCTCNACRIYLPK